MYKPSYELIGIKERKEGRLELLLFLLLDESFTFSQNTKNIDCRKAWGRLGFTSTISTSAFCTKHSLFLLEKEIIIISTTLAVDYLIWFLVIFKISFFFCRYHRYPLPPRPLFGFFVMARKKYEQMNNSDRLI